MAGMTGGALGSDSHGDHFRPDLEGLRAVAVLLVLLYHAGVPGFGGGFVGVDVFFVLSGFLITSLLLRELHSTGTLSIAGFYARRARRLLPAAGLVLIVTLVGSVVFLSPLRIPTVSADIGAAGLYVSNFRFAAQANDYFAAGGTPSPVLHYWSLSVEEQFYIVWPGLLLLLYRWGRSWIGIAVGVIVVASFGLSLVLTGVNQPVAFYLLPTRAWQLGVGALLSLAALRFTRINPALGATLTLLGVVAAAAASLAFSDRTPFPGMAAALPVAAAALVIVGGMPSGGTVASRWLAVRPVRYLGTISYSVYLWHWPLLVLAAGAVGHALSPRAGIAVAAMSIPIAAVTQRLVEAPLRRGVLIGAVPRRNLGQAALLSGAIVVACVLAARLPLQLGGSVAAASEPGSVAVADLVPPLAEAATPWPNCFCGAPDGDSATCVAGNPAAATTVALFGDSHATAWFPAMARLADERDWRLLNITEGSCLSIEVNHLDTNLRQYCANWRPRAIARIVRERPQIVVMTNRSWYNLVKPGGEEPLYPPDDGYAEVWKAGLASAIAEIRPYVGSIVILGDTPRLGFVGPDCIAQHSDYATRCTTPRSTAITEDILDGERAVAEATGSIFIDPTDWFCSKDTCPAVIGRYIAYLDTAHLTIPFAESLAAPLGAALPSPAP